MTAPTATMPRDYYEVLGVAHDAEAEAIKQAYKRLALRYHPDRAKDPDAERRFKEASEAFAVLSDPDKRARYDRFGPDGLSGSMPRSVDLADIFGELFGGGGGLFDQLFGGGRRSSGGARQRRRPQRGEDLTGVTEITLADVLTGVTKTLDFDRDELCAFCGGSGTPAGSQPTPCATCGGRGAVQQQTGFFLMQTTCPACQGAGQRVTERCEKCQGSGAKTKNISVELKIPPGVQDGMVMRVPGEGGPGLFDGPRGDLHVSLSVEPHPIYERDPEHPPTLWTTVFLGVAEAALGTEIELPGLDGKRLRVPIPAGTQPGDAVRLKKQGLPDLRTGRRGELAVRVTVEIPKKLKGRAKEALRRLGEHEEAHRSSARRRFEKTLRRLFDAANDEADDDSAGEAAD